MKMKYKLIRHDGLEKASHKIMWVEWGEDKRFKRSLDKITEGTSLLMSPFNAFYTWLTTPVTEILEQREDYLKFKTENSDYELFIDLECSED